jgi:hypothetical protein
LPKNSDIHARKFVAGMWKGARGRIEAVSARRQWCLEWRKKPLQERQQRSKQHTHFDSIRSVAEKLLNKIFRIWVSKHRSSHKTDLPLLALAFSLQISLMAASNLRRLLVESELNSCHQEFISIQINHLQHNAGDSHYRASSHTFGHFFGHIFGRGGQMAHCGRGVCRPTLGQFPH